MDNKSLILMTKEEFAKAIEAKIRIGIYRNVIVSGDYVSDKLRNAILFGGTNHDNRIGEDGSIDADYQE